MQICFDHRVIYSHVIFSLAAFSTLNFYMNNVCGTWNSTTHHFEPIYKTLDMLPWRIKKQKIPFLRTNTKDALSEHPSSTEGDTIVGALVGLKVSLLLHNNPLPGWHFKEIADAVPSVLKQNFPRQLDVLSEFWVMLTIIINKVEKKHHRRHMLLLGLS